MSNSKATQIKAIKWQDPSKFTISMTGSGAGILKALGLPDSDVLTVACQGIGLAEVNANPIEDWVAEEWRFAIGRLEQYNISITFKDYNNFQLYKTFAQCMQWFSRMYPDDQKFNVEIETADDFGVDNFAPTVHFKDCLLVSVSGATLDNSAVSSIAEFTVTLKCSYIETF